jgi:glycogen synthase
MLSWEYPPLVVGGIAAHVDGLARAMARAGHEVVVLTLHHHDAPNDAVVEGVRVLRAHVDLPWIPEHDLVAVMASANHHIVKLAAALGDWRPDVVHSHDWLTAWAGDVLRTWWGVPLVATIHATERGRHGGHLPAGQPAAINAAEWWLTYQATTVVCCSEFMRWQVIDGFELPPDKVRLIPNGVDLAHWAPPAGAVADRRPLVLAWGRVQYEKGFQVLARAIAQLRPAHPELECIIAGRGSYLPELQMQVDVEGVGDVVSLPGFVPDDELRGLLHQAGCVVIPSLYEPFGIVALEAMAAGAPVVAARTGGLAEIVAGTDAGVMFEPADVDDLVAAIDSVLGSTATARALQARARTLLTTRYSWDAIAAETITAYRLSLSVA